MIYTDKTKAAMRLCFEAHKDQLDKSGLPYVFHPLLVAEQMSTEEEVCVALLHDVMEDTALTVDDIREAGMSEDVVEALLLMTHNPSVEYMDYVASLADNPLARRAKMADLCHNMNVGRLDSVTKADWQRQEKYAQAYRMLEQVDARDGTRERDCGSSGHYSLMEIMQWFDRLLDMGVDPRTRVVIDRERGLNGYSYVDDLYCDHDRYPDDPTVLLGSYKRRTKALRLMHRQ